MHSFNVRNSSNLSTPELVLRFRHLYEATSPYSSRLSSALPRSSLVRYDFVQTSDSVNTHNSQVPSFQAQCP